MKSNKHFLLAQQEPEEILFLLVPREMKLLGNSHLDYSSKAELETTDTASATGRCTLGTGIQRYAPTLHTKWAKHPLTVVLV